MKRSITVFGILALVCAAFMVNFGKSDISSAGGSYDLKVTVWTWNNAKSMEEGDTCGRDLLVGGAEYSPYRQLVVRDASGKIVNVAMLTQGTVNDDGNWGSRCGIEATLTLTDSPYYTFSIAEDGFDFTLPYDVLESNDWSVEFHPGY